MAPLAFPTRAPQDGKGTHLEAASPAPPPHLHPRSTHWAVFARRVSDTPCHFGLMFNDPRTKARRADAAGERYGLEPCGREGAGLGWGSRGGAPGRGPGPVGGDGDGGRRPGAPPAGSGAKGQAEGSARGAGAAARVTAARPSHPQLGRGGRGGLGQSPAVCISLAGGGAWVERNSLHLERCLFFLTSQSRQTTSRARRPDSPEPSLGKGSGQGAARRKGAASPRHGNALGSPPPHRGRVGEGSRWGGE